MRLIYASDLKLYIMRHLLIDEDSTPEEIERQMLRAIDVQPAIDADVVRHGHWITHNPNNPFEIYGECSECGLEQSLSGSLPYCPFVAQKWMKRRKIMIIITKRKLNKILERRYRL